jgi:ribosomal protein S18 acetylase RimI-like enzyme
MRHLVQLAAADFERIVDLWERAGLPLRPTGRDSQEAFADQLEGGRQTVLGLQEGENLLGVVVVTHDSRKGWINRLAVDPAFRRQGIATSLLTAAEEYLQSQGIQVFAALIHEDNQESIATFGQAGYVRIPEVLYLSKRLNPGA